MNVNPLPSPSDPSSSARTVLGRLLMAVFGEFDRSSLRVAVLRHADDLPDYTRNDVDLLVHPGSLDSATEIIQRLAREQGWSVLATLKKFKYRCLILQLPGDEPQFLPIDLVTGLNYRYFPFANAYAGLTRCRRTDAGIPSVTSGFESAFALVKELLAKNAIRLNCRESIAHGAREDAAGFKAALSGHFSDPRIEQLRSMAASGDWDALAGKAWSLRRRVKRARVNLIPRLTRYALQTARHYFKPPLSCFAVLVGPDGSGKTTLMEAVSQQLEANPFKVVHCFKSTFGILPPLRRLKNRLRRLAGKPPLMGAAERPGTFHSGMIRPNPLLASLVYIAYYTLDLWLGRLMLRRLRGQCALVLFDRYYYDYYYQIGNRKVPRWYLRFFEWFIPRPDLIFEIERDAEDIFDRKPELSVEEIREEQQRIRQLLQTRSNARQVDGMAGIESSSATLTRIILDRTRQNSSPAVSIVPHS